MAAISTGETTMEYTVLNKKATFPVILYYGENNNNNNNNNSYYFVITKRMTLFPYNYILRSGIRIADLIRG
jgi:hypothetical protein